MKPLSGFVRAREARVTLAAITSAALLWVIWPYVGAIFWSIVLAIVFAPLYRWLLKASGSRQVVAGLGTLVVLVLGIGVPVTLVMAALMRDARGLYGDIAARRIDFGSYLQRIAGALPDWARTAFDHSGLGDLTSIREKLSASAVEASQYMATHVFGIGMNIFSFAVSLAITLYLLYVLLGQGKTLATKIEDFSPLDPDETASLVNTFATVIRATVKGGVVMAVVQGALGGTVLGALGISAPLFWGVVFGLLSMIPAVDAGLLWAPIALYFLVTGAIWKGLLLIVFGAVVLTAVDNILRPILVGRDTHLPGYLVLVTTLGGVATFAVNGIIIGPVIAALFIATWNLFGAMSPKSRDGSKPYPRVDA